MGLQWLLSITEMASCYGMKLSHITILVENLYVSTCRLHIHAFGITAPLPDFLPGACPSLITLNLELPDAWDPALPASWGHHDVLPQLSNLVVLLPALVNLPMPSPGGFGNLVLLNIEGVHLCRRNSRNLQQPLFSSPTGLPDPSAPAMKLPPEWATDNSFPSLQTLILRNLGLASSIPSSWHQAGFPSITVM